MATIDSINVKTVFRDEPFVLRFRFKEIRSTGECTREIPVYLSYEEMIKLKNFSNIAISQYRHLVISADTYPGVVLDE